MIIWFLLILIVALVNIQVCRDGFFSDYLEKNQSNAIKGVFILLVFVFHSLTDIKNCGFSFEHQIDWLAQAFHLEIGQLVVAMFFFYSGYGVMKSLLVKGEAYLNSYPKSRLLTTLLNFDIAVCFFILLATIIGRRVSVSQIALSLIGWESVGNSCWYIFVILFCFLAFYLVFKLVGTRFKLGIVAIALVCLVGMFTLRLFKPSLWYNTMLVFPAGIAYAVYADKLERLIQKRYILSVVLLFAAFFSLHFLMRSHPLHGLTFNVKSIVFALLIVVLTMKVRIGNQWLYWCGSSLFPLYIYQRLPMISLRAMAGKEWIVGHPNLFICCCFVITVGISLLYNKYFRIKLV